MEHEDYIILFNKIVESINSAYFKDRRVYNRWRMTERYNFMVRYLRPVAEEEVEELRINHTHNDNYVKLIYLRGQWLKPATTFYEINVDMTVFYRYVEELFGCNDDYSLKKILHNIDTESALGNLE